MNEQIKLFLLELRKFIPEINNFIIKYCRTLLYSKFRKKNYFILLLKIININIIYGILWVIFIIIIFFIDNLNFFLCGRIFPYCYKTSYPIVFTNLLSERMNGCGYSNLHY